MKYETTPAFDADFKRLSDDEKKLFRKALTAFIQAADRLTANPASRWPKSLRVKDVESAVGVWEMTWSFSGPDGRATFEWITIDGERAIRWRRVGGHEVFKEP